MSDELEVTLDSVANALDSVQFVHVRRRIFRQLIESLIYENIIEPEINKSEGRKEVFHIKGYDEAGNILWYVCSGQRKLSFDRIRLSKHRPVIRVTGEQKKEADSLAIFLLEIAPCMKEKPKRLQLFMEEINQTLLKDTIAQYRRHKIKHAKQEKEDESERGYDELEGDVMEGHPYHPCYKSRVGFDLIDNEAFGPDLKPNFKLIWIALNKDYAKVSTSDEDEYTAFIQKELESVTYARFEKKLKKQGGNPADYVFLPIHPWQWREKVLMLFFEQMRAGQIILLGEGEDNYRPQQSIRTLANQTFPQKAYVKLSLSITNTSSSRVLLPRHVRNGPIVSGWLDEFLKKDDYLREELGLVFLIERIGISYDYDTLPEIIREKSYGALGVIWRDDVYRYLRPNEKAIPFTSLCHIEANNRPFIDSWVKEYGLENWLKQVLQVSLPPLLHLLYAHGAAIEAHAQNMIVIHRQGIPVRLAVRDFSGGVLFYKEKDPDPDLPETDQPTEVRNVFHNAFFFINLAELSMFLEEQYDLDEYLFWLLVVEVIRSYHQQFPHLKNQFKRFDLFQPTVEIGQLTRRKIVDPIDKGDHKVANVLNLYDSI
ncbi:IucA/IucC family protein [Salipaludibacillus sp. HK11]|uniref:IucA/IucC family protein n=1 Tax=Salipaludibacillus sp. HK11 TaxID=3394320 RepID=UPI0039FD2484